MKIENADVAAALDLLRDRYKRMREQEMIPVSLLEDLAKIQLEHNCNMEDAIMVLFESF